MISVACRPSASGSRLTSEVTRRQRSRKWLKIDPAFERAQVERLRKTRAERDSAAAKAALDEVERAARSGENLMPKIIAAVEAYATLGEVADTMRRVFGEYSETM